MQFTIRWMLASVVVAGLIFGCFAWLLRSQARDVHDAFIEIGPYTFWSDSPAFWAILGLVLAVVVGVLVGFIAVLVFAAKAIGRRIIRKA